ncbi:MAG: hypothetical protein FD180_4143 [Planctomycetota bacterium]|nr:MAG: hypothetical protein FD180_4143 [Planctomycetota bacterium]
MSGVIGTVLVLAGALLLIGSTIWLLIEAFRVGLLWGLAVIFIPIVPLIFIIVHWERAKGAVGYYVLGWILMLAGFIMSGHRRERLGGPILSPGATASMLASR